MEKLAVYGAGGFGREIAWLFEVCSENKIAFFIDDDPKLWGSRINGIPVTALEELRSAATDILVVVAVGSPKTRQMITEKVQNAGFEIASLVHPRTEMSRSVEISEGAVVCAGCTLTVNIKIKKHVQINLDCTIGHDAVVDDYTTLAPGVHVSGWVHFGKRVYVGTGAVIINGMEGEPLVIGDDAVIGAGACVTKSIPAGETWVGVPAKAKNIRKIVESVATEKMKRIFLSPPHMDGSEERYVREAFESNYIAPMGPQVDAFEKAFAEYTGIRHCLALSSGTAAMHLVLQILGVGSGDEVFASTLTFIGSVSPVTFLGGRLVFIDCDRETWNMDPDLLEEELKRCARRGKLPKAVIPTDLYGQCSDYDRIFDICAGYDVPVVVDAAEALGARFWGRDLKAAGLGAAATLGRHAGKGVKAAIFSFNGNKIITTSGGGMLASDDIGLIERARFLSQQAREPFPHYEHAEIGYNYRMSNIAAAIGLGQMGVLDERVAKKREIFEYYRRTLEEFPGIEFMPEAAYGRCTRWLTVALIEPSLFGADRERVRLALEAENIESRPVWKPMHLQPVFDVEAGLNQTNVGGGKKRYPARVVGGAVSEALFEKGLCLPSGTAMGVEDLERVVGVVKREGVREKARERGSTWWREEVRA